MSNTKTKLVFDFWKNNQNDQHFQLTIGEVVAKFTAWKDFQINENKDRGQSWYEYYYGSQAVRSFIGDKENILGLQSVSDNDQFNGMYELIRKHL